MCLQVDYYGAPTPLKSLASIAVPDASTLTIAPFDKGSIKDIEKALNESDIGINPSNDGQKIRLVIPPMTQVRCAGWCFESVQCTDCLGVREVLTAG
jgi:ribosome recycling factor